jgi:hypothetical protein
VFERIKPSGHKRRDALALFSLAAIMLTVLAVASSDPTALCVLPALVLPVLFTLRRYPGERILAALSGTRRRRRQRLRSCAPPSARPAIGLPRGGLLLARSLAVRPPPSVSFAAS